VDSKYKIALIGNPNSGKTTLFNRLTGAKRQTGNWPGVTVEKKRGAFNFGNIEHQVTDLPGVYAIEDENASIDEQIARNFVLDNPDYYYINIIDSTTLERGLLLSLQLKAQGVKRILILNMVDRLDANGIEIDIEQLSLELDCEVIPICAKKEFDFLPIQKAMKALVVRSVTTNKNKEQAQDVILRMQNNFKKSKAIVTRCVTYSQVNRFNVSDKIDNWVLGAWSGVGLFFLVVYALFLFSINLGGALIDFFDLATGAIFVDGLRALLISIHAPEFLQVLLADGIGGGIQVVATFVPIIGALYLFLSLLEEVGYMARAAFVMDKFMRKIGLSGKAFIPLIVGFGCNVPGIMASRTLDSERERITTVLMSPFMSCGARLAVYALFAAAFFPVGGQNIVFALYLIGVIFAILTGLLLKRIFANTQDSVDFLMELPAYQLPSLYNLFLNTWHKLKGFLLGAGKIIILVVSIINVVNSIGLDGSFNHQNSEKSALSALAKFITPVFSPLGIEQENWPATVGIISGVLAKEVVVGTLDSLYSDLDRPSVHKPSNSHYDLWKELNKAFKTLPVNFSKAVKNLFDPLGLRILQANSDFKLDLKDTFGAMVARFDGKAGAFAYLLFILLYFPCVAALGAMAREVGRTWATIGAFWSTGLAYVSSIAFYQSVTFLQHPLSSSIWLLLSMIFLTVIVILLMYYGKKAAKKSIPIETLNSTCRHC
jgi:ferrous iron transport protein B